MAAIEEDENHGLYEMALVHTVTMGHTIQVLSSFQLQYAAFVLPELFLPNAWCFIFFTVICFFLFPID
jgi:hypothetical protein